MCMGIIIGTRCRQTQIYIERFPLSCSILRQMSSVSREVDTEE